MTKEVERVEAHTQGPEEANKAAADHSPILTMKGSSDLGPKKDFLSDRLIL